MYILLDVIVEQDKSQQELKQGLTLSLPDDRNTSPVQTKKQTPKGIYRLGEQKRRK
jgi:hypothetical protein